MQTMTKHVHTSRPLMIPSGFIWLKHLDSDEQADFFSGLLKRIPVAIKTNDWSPVSEWVEEWKATANIYADPTIARAVAQGRKELDTGNFIDWESLRAELGL